MTNPKPTNYTPDLFNHALLSATLSSAIITASLISKEILGKYNKLPHLKPKDIIPFFLLIMPSTYIVDYLQRYEYIPYILDFNFEKKRS